MNTTSKKCFTVAACLLMAFIIWTALVRFVDVKPIGPDGSSVGFATLNKHIHGVTGTNMTLYTITDWLGLVPIATAFGFAVLGLIQTIRRKSPLMVDKSILALGVFYIVVIATYILFEAMPINYRPILINGHLEASYPSSTTMLVVFVMPTALMQINSRLKSTLIKRSINVTTVLFVVFMVFGRILSGVHWITDIIGGLIFSSALIVAYDGLCKQLVDKSIRNNE
jgi:undecaprenyl-diphosphatase